MSEQPPFESLLSPIDDLLQQDALLDGVEQAVRQLFESSRVLSVGKTVIAQCYAQMPVRSEDRQ